MHTADRSVSCALLWEVPQRPRFLIILFSLPCTSIRCPQGEEGREELVCHVGLDVIVWGEPTNTCGDDFKSSHQNYAGDSFSLWLQFSKHFQLMSFDPQIWPSQLGNQEWIGDRLWHGSACQLWEKLFFLGWCGAAPALAGMETKALGQRWWKNRQGRLWISRGWEDYDVK